ncbi:hypothetical protein B7494_g8249 [Chlorociboria aeruginascens]|nr:hypothetical protein B7494_g8249 [Chlorociboria aeruginascens]
MEIRRAAQSLTRGVTHPLSSFVSNSATSRCRVSMSVAAHRRNPLSKKRQFSTSTNLQAAKPTTTIPAPLSASTPTSQPPADLSWLSKPRSTILPSPASLARERSLNKGSSEADIRDEFYRLMAHQNTESGSRLPPYSPFGRGPASSQNRLDVSRMAIPNPPGFSAPPSPTNAMHGDRGMLADIVAGMPSTERVPLRLDARLGRTVTVDGRNVDLGRGIRLLEMSCSRNRVRYEFNKQRFHERGGLKRKRLRRERWRKRFMDGFKATVGRVRQLKNQGW